MAVGEKKVSLMNRIISAPGNSKLYIVLDDGSYGYILKSDFLSALSETFNKTIQYSGGTITTITGFSGTIFNQSRNEFVTYTESAGVLTITSGNVDTDEILIITNN